MPGPEPLLSQLRDIHLPMPAEPALFAWAQIPAQWLTAAMLLLALIGVLAFARWQRRRLHAALRALRQLERRHATDGDAVELARGLATLLRQQAAACFPASRAAGLIDDEWLDFLDAHGGKGNFRHGPGAVLTSLPYRARADAAVDAAALLALTERWLRANPG
jgi:hypothetical protein